MSELDVLRRLGDDIVPQPFEALVETARRRDRRTRIATRVGVAAVIVAVSATAYLARNTSRDLEPAPPVPAPSGRPLTYADGNTIHYGDKTVESDGPVVELDVTDDGVGFRTDDGGMWFTDGSSIDSLGALGETGPGYGDPWPLTQHPGWMLSSNSGSRLVWFEFPAPGEPEVVVYDTASDQEVAREAVELEPGHTAVPELLSDRFVYWIPDPDSGLFAGEQTTHIRFDPSTGEQSRVQPAALLSDLDGDAAARSVRMKGNSWSEAVPGFHYNDGMNLQMGVDLKEEVAGVDGVAPVGSGDLVATDVHGQPFAFQPPSGYTKKAGVAWLVQWLDDETVIVASPLRQQTDFLACHLDTSTCEVAASAPTGVVVPELGRSDFIG